MGARQRLRRALALIVLFRAAVCGAERVHSATSFIPIPEIITDPNEGNTLGFLGVFLFLDDKDEIRYMLAPDIRYNKTKGVFPSLRLFAYPSPTRRYSIEVGKSTTRDEDYELDFTDRGYWDGRTFVIASFVRQRDSTERFFGPGNQPQQAGRPNCPEPNTIPTAPPGGGVLPPANLSPA